jgi:hypothetical protein
MKVLTKTSLYGGHRVRVMWERPAGIWHRPPLKWWIKPAPVYVFIGYIRGLEQPTRICLRGDRDRPFIIEDPLDYDGGDFNHGPHAKADRYDEENGGHTLADLFEMLHRWARSDDLNQDEQQVLERTLDEFYAWIWREHRRDRPLLPGNYSAG